MARRGAQLRYDRPQLTPNPSIRRMKSEIESRTTTEWINRWETSTDCRQTKYFWGVPSKSESQVLISHPMSTVSRLVRFITGHAFLRRQNAIVKTGLNPPPGDISCRLCEDPVSEETPHHLITECEALHFWRNETLGSRFLDEYPCWKIKDLIKFLGDKGIILLETD